MSRLQKRLLASASAVILALGLSVAISTPAQAADCQTNQFCISDTQSGFGGVDYYWTLTGYVNGQCTNIGSPWNNTARWASNQVANSYTVQLWTGNNCTGLVITQLRSWTVRTADCGFYPHWVALHSPCNAPTGSSFRYVF